MVRKTVTLVFCDVADSTPLGERLDPEALRDVWSRYHESARVVLERHGGTIEKFIGDAVMAAFGIPVVHEDDALRAVRAAAELRGELETLNDQLERAYGVRIGVRTGINTGEVIVGDPSQGQAFATGDAVNVAQRLEATVEGRCLPYGQGITYWPLAQIVRQLCGELPPAEAVAGLLAGDPDADLVTERVLEAIGQAPPRSRSDELYWAIRRLLETLARDRPVIVVLDDVQWAESAFLDLVEYLAGWSLDAALLLVCLARRDLLDVRPGWGAGGVSGTVIPLAPLGTAETRLLIDGILGSDQLQSLPEAAILRTTGGNPLFVEEMVRMLIEDGVLRERDGTWEAPRSLQSLRVPETIQAVLAARLDLLEPDERTILQRASVIGEVFWWSALAELADGEEVAGTGAVLQT